jgi:hypothetical protein
MKELTMRSGMTPDLSNVAFVFTCDACAAEYFPGATLPRVADVLGSRDWDSEMHSAVVHAACAADFVANGFEIVGPDPGENAGADLYCPHYKWDAAADEWTRS